MTISKKAAPRPLSGSRPKKSAVLVAALATPQSHTRFESGESVIYRGGDGRKLGDIIVLAEGELVDSLGVPRKRWNGPAPSCQPFGRLKVIEGVLPSISLPQDEGESRSSFDILLANKSDVIVAELSSFSSRDLAGILEQEKRTKKRKAVIEAIKRLEGKDEE